MSWWGKLFGGTFGFMLGGPLGAIIGAALGHNLDARMDRLAVEQQGPSGRERIQTAFFTATFSVMGHLAKADGRVSEDEIRLAQVVMDRMQLPPPLKKLARKLFSEGKQPDFPLDDILDQLKRECRYQHTLLRMFVEIQLQAAFADGVMHPAERRILDHVCAHLGFSRAELERLEAMIRAAGSFHGARGSYQPATDLSQAYAVLNVAPDASDDEIKRAYRRLMNQHHPDKLVAKGLPEEMMKLATEKTHEIRQAYEQIRAARRP